MLNRIQNRFQQQYADFYQGIEQFKKKSNPKQIHDLRVLSRRLRANIFLLEQTHIHQKKYSKIKKKIKQINRSLSPLRSHDVNQELVGKISSLKPIHDWMKVERNRMKKEITRQLQDISLPKKIPMIHKNKKATDAQKQKWEKHLDLKTNQLRCSAQSAFEKLAKNPSLFNLHQLRISLKKYRYIVEIQSLFHHLKDNPVIKIFKSLQDQMGSIHDVDVLTQYLSSPPVMKKMRKPSLKQNYFSLLKKLKKQMVRQIESFIPRNKSKMQKLLVK